MSKLHRSIASIGYAACLGFVDACLINLHHTFAQAPRINKNLLISKVIIKYCFNITVKKDLFEG